MAGGTGEGEQEEEDVRYVKKEEKERKQEEGGEEQSLQNSEPQLRQGSTLHGGFSCAGSSPPFLALLYPGPGPVPGVSSLPLA